MTNEEIFRLAEQHGDWDDFGRWNFKDDGLINFVLAIAEAEKQEPMYVDSSRFPRGPLNHKPGTIIAKPVHAIDILQECVDETAKNQHEPVAWAEITKDYVAVSDEPFENAIPLYTTPPERKWVGLTYDEINEIYDEYGQCRKYGYEEAIEEKLKEKNI